MRNLMLALSLFLFAPLGVSAQTIPGTDAPAFRAATQDWLAGADDLSALQAFSDLAHADNRAAQIFLGRIGQMPHMTQHVTEGMPRADRIALLRSPGGLSGRSWMEAAAIDVPLAAAFMDNAVQAERLNSLRLLFEAGEVAVATRSLTGVLAHGPEDSMAALADLDVMPDEARILMVSALTREMYWTSGQRITVPDPLRSRTPPELALIWRPIAPFEFRDDETLRAMALDASPQVASLAPIHNFCTRMCPGDVSTCTATGVSLMANTSGVFPFASPAESLIPTADYWASARFEGDMMRLLAQVVDPDAQTGYVDMNACFMQAASN